MIGVNAVGHPIESIPISEGPEVNTGEATCGLCTSCFLSSLRSAGYCLKKQISSEIHMIHFCIFDMLRLSFFSKRNQPSFMLKAALKTNFLLINSGKMTMCFVKGLICRDKPTENYLLTVVPHNSTKLSNIFQLTFV